MRLVIFQPLVPAYRIPVFRELGRKPEIDLTVYAGGSSGSLSDVREEAGFRRREARLYTFSFFGRSAKVQPAHCRVIMGNEADVIVFSWDAQFLLLPIILLICRGRGIPTLLWGHGYSKRPTFLTDAIRNCLGRMATGVIVYDHTTAKSLVLEAGYLPARVFCAQNAIDQAPIREARSKWEKCASRLAEFQKEKRLDPKKTIIFVSRLESDNQLGMAIDALEIIHKSDPEVRLVIVGDGPERAVLERRVGYAGLSEKVLLVGSIYNEEELAGWMLSATVFSYPRNIGLSLLHAFGYGIPVVTSDNRFAQNPEIDALVDGVNGLLYRDGDSNDMAAKWLAIISDAQLRGRLSRGAEEQVANNFTLENMVNGFLEAVLWASRRDG